MGLRDYSYGEVSTFVANKLPDLGPTVNVATLEKFRKHAFAESSPKAVRDAYGADIAALQPSSLPANALHTVVPQTIVNNAPSFVESNGIMGNREFFAAIPPNQHLMGPWTMPPQDASQAQPSESHRSQFRVRPKVHRGPGLASKSTTAATQTEIRASAAEAASERSGGVKPRPWQQAGVLTNPRKRRAAQITKKRSRAKTSPSKMSVSSDPSLSPIMDPADYKGSFMAYLAAKKSALTGPLFKSATKNKSKRKEVDMNSPSDLLALFRFLAELELSGETKATWIAWERFCKKTTIFHRSSDVKIKAEIVNAIDGWIDSGSQMGTFMTQLWFRLSLL